MEFKDIKLLYSAGDLSQAVIRHSECKEGYNLFFHRISTGGECALFTRRTGLRKFKTIDSAVSNAGLIGFHSVTVVF